MSLFASSIEPIQVQYLSKLRDTSENKPQDKPAAKILRSKIFYIGMMLNMAFPRYHQGALLSAFTTMEHNLTEVFNWDEQQATLYISIANTVTVLFGIGSFFLISMLKNYGRRQLMIYCLLLTPIGSVCTMVVNEPIFILGRCIQGLSFGALSTIPATMIREFATKEYKGLCSVLLPIIFRIGTAVQYGLGFFLPKEQNVPTNGEFSNQFWRFMLGWPAITSLINIACFLFIWTDESPNFIYINTKGDKEKTMQSLLKIFHQEKADQEYESIVYINKQKSANTQEIGIIEVFKRYPRQMIVGLFLMCAYILNGIDIILIYSADILKNSGMSSSSATIWSVILISGDLFGLFIGSYLLQKINRKTQFLTFVFLLALCDVNFGILIYVHQDNLYTYNVFLFRLFYTTGISSVIWGYLPDILPLNGVSFDFALSNILSSAQIASYKVLCNIFNIQIVFLSYGILSFCCFIVLLFIMKETKGLNKDEIMRLFMSTNQRESCKKSLLANDINIDQDQEQENIQSLKLSADKYSEFKQSAEKYSEFKQSADKYSEMQNS